MRWCALLAALLLLQPGVAVADGKPFPQCEGTDRGLGDFTCDPKFVQLTRSLGWLNFPYIGLGTPKDMLTQNADNFWYRADAFSANFKVEDTDVTVDHTASGTTPDMVIATAGTYRVEIWGSTVVPTGVQRAWEVTVFRNDTGTGTPGSSQAADPGDRITTIDANVQNNLNRPMQSYGMSEFDAVAGDELSLWARTKDTTDGATLETHGFDMLVTRVEDAGVAP